MVPFGLHLHQALGRGGQGCVEVLKDVKLSTVRREIVTRLRRDGLELRSSDFSTLSDSTRGSRRPVSDLNSRGVVTRDLVFTIEGPV